MKIVDSPNIFLLKEMIIAINYSDLKNKKATQELPFADVICLLLLVNFVSSESENKKKTAKDTPNHLNTLRPH